MGAIGLRIMGGVVGGGIMRRRRVAPVDSPELSLGSRCHSLVGWRHLFLWSRRYCKYRAMDRRINEMGSLLLDFRCYSQLRSESRIGSDSWDARGGCQP